jgi:hypothetical protein
MLDAPDRDGSLGLSELAQIAARRIARRRLSAFALATALTAAALALGVFVSTAAFLLNAR